MCNWVVGKGMQDRKILAWAGGIGIISLLAYAAHILINLFTPIVVILPDGASVEGRVFGSNPSNLLIAEGIRLEGLDIITPGAEAGVYYLGKSVPVNFRGPGGFVQRTFTTAPKVEGFLDEAGIEVVPLDIVEPGMV